MSSNEKSSTVIGITVSAEYANQLYSAYLGLPTNRQTIVDDKVKAGATIHQATFEEIFVPKLLHYVEKGEEARREIANKAVAMLSCLSPTEKAELLAKLGQ